MVEDIDRHAKGTIPDAGRYWYRHSSKMALLGATRPAAVTAFCSNRSILKTRRAEYCGTLFTVLLISLMWVGLLRSRLPRFLRIFSSGQKVDPESDQRPIQRDGFRYLQKLPRVLYETSLVNHVCFGYRLGCVYGFGFVKQAFFPSSTTPSLQNRCMDAWRDGYPSDQRNKSAGKLVIELKEESSTLQHCG